ncbi:uncharacterized protein JNUCC1_02925 [Lentibacillus sp. JNUCC-1]|uniref:TIGR03826 family flagellar region protein n=1 Tax=Lentibacillus sp. JNUCC-1 TaxID=2654513 RepID=UPI0012E9584A|nr:TIGR03826 family flagellar region protein [Lentibacillus sp. JNUCC-1]MUV39053.1 uncharacterized protein [Lentibacillus sp. JNUCC-1]
MGELANCQRCDTVFVKTIRDICHDCYKQEEEAFDTVYAFLQKKKNREATIVEIVAATEVSEELIIKFIKEKRLRASDFPKLAYPCEKCGTGIVTGRLCESCANDIKTDLSRHESIEQLEHTRMKKSKERQYAYYNLERSKE